ncbi:Rieske 2Fe-2S domain-containing protein [Nocardioides convexus]|uniref:Rieske 2Fe-2S domain-containing protein n=1 Tax=Nocardioides convexus TaxID=2712224 RepID=UPI0031013521
MTATTSTRCRTSARTLPYRLSEGEVADCTIECWLHGSTFDLRTGKPTTFPATEPVATFPVEVRDGDVYVDVETTLNGVTPA